jgi:ComF family protein
VHFLRFAVNVKIPATVQSNSFIPALYLNYSGLIFRRATQYFQILSIFHTFEFQSLIMKIPGFIEDFISLLYPRVCAACGNSLFKHEEIICTYCLYHLPKTNYHLLEESPLDKVFWGRAQLKNTAALYTFQKKSKVQHLIHQLKYKGRMDVGIHLGELFGADLIKAEAFRDIIKVVPVPLHPEKQRKRGYNQSEQFAIGLAKAMNIEMDATSFIRTVDTATQTRKSRFARWENVKEIFKVTAPEKLANSHILLVDDVITTGATLESAAHILLAIEGVKLSVACIGFARE